MRYEPISFAKNNLSALLKAVAEGQSIVITDRGVPVARLEPVGATSDDVRSKALVERGLVRLPARKPGEPVGKPVSLPRQASLLEALLEDREVGR
jgi:prevent-host-death family protein